MSSFAFRNGNKLSALLRGTCSRLLASLKSPRAQLASAAVARYTLPLLWSTYYVYHLQRSHKVRCGQLEDRVTDFQARQSGIKLQTLTGTHKSLWSAAWSILTHALRLLQLLVIFAPVILLFPFRKVHRVRDLWLDMFVAAVERSGVVWIKAFQYMSHRRDIIGPDMADKFVHLRENAPQHRFQVTREMIRQKCGREIEDVFEEFAATPIASGSVSQVYKAKYKGETVAVKVRHPGVDRYIQRDINILFAISRFLSLFSKKFNLPVTEISMKKTLIDQIDFNNERKNLIIFNQLFQGRKDVKFPLPINEDSSENVLIETFVEGVPITFFERNRHPLNNVIAKIGATVFFQMLVKHNFIHADCHGGNIIVAVKPKNQGPLDRVRQFLLDAKRKVQQYFTFMSLNTDKLRQLFKESKQEERQIREIMKQSSERVEMNLIDVGMVIRLDERDRTNFINFIRSVLHGEGEKCAQMIYTLSISGGRKVAEGEYQEYMSELRRLFQVIDGQPISESQGLQLFVGMLETIREHNMKLEGEFATLLTNMLVLEAMAKDLNPQINLLKCAIPYFKYVDSPVASRGL